MTLGEKIQILRKQKGMTQDQLADILNVSRQAVSKWETNESQPDIERLIEIGNLFNVSTDYLIKDGYASDPIKRTRVAEKESLRNSRIFFLVSAVYSLGTGVFLLLGFVWGLWHPGWIVLFMPPFIVRVLQHIMSKNMEDYQAFEEAIEREDD